MTSFIKEKDLHTLQEMNEDSYEALAQSVRDNLLLFHLVRKLYRIGSEIKIGINRAIRFLIVYERMMNEIEKNQTEYNAKIIKLITDYSLENELSQENNPEKELTLNCEKICRKIEQLSVGHNPERKKLLNLHEKVIKGLEERLEEIYD